MLVLLTVRHARVWVSNQMRLLPKTKGRVAVGEADGRHYLAMEYMDQGSLEERVARVGRLPWTEALGVLCDAAAGQHDPSRERVGPVWSRCRGEAGGVSTWPSGGGLQSKRCPAADRVASGVRSPVRLQPSIASRSSNCETVAPK